MDGGETERRLELMWDVVKPLGEEGVVDVGYWIRRGGGG